MLIEFELPYPPSVNHYWRRVGHQTLISRSGRAFREQVCSLLAARRIKPLAGPLHVRIEVFPPDNRRRDLDNLPKALLDALQHGGAYHDDSQIVALSITKHEVVPAGRARVTIETAPC